MRSFLLIVSLLVNLYLYTKTQKHNKILVGPEVVQNEAPIEKKEPPELDLPKINEPASEQNPNPVEEPSEYIDPSTQQQPSDIFAQYSGEFLNGYFAGCTARQTQLLNTQKINKEDLLDCNHPSLIESESNGTTEGN